MAMVGDAVSCAKTTLGSSARNNAHRRTATIESLCRGLYVQAPKIPPRHECASMQGVGDDVRLPKLKAYFTKHLSFNVPSSDDAGGHISSGISPATLTPVQA